MRSIKYAKSFKDDLKKVRRYPHYDEGKLANLINIIASGTQLDAKYSDHAMAKQSRGEYIGSREFHLSPDICVVYRVSDSDVTVQRIGKHNQLRLTSSLKL